jgi:hypothetical protein
MAVDTLDNVHVLTDFNNGTKVVAKVFNYDSAGTLVGSRTVFVPNGSIAFADDMAIDNNGDSYMTVRDTAPGKGAFLRKLTNSGSTIWTRRLEPTTTNSVTPRAVAVDSDNNVYVAGSINNAAYPGFTNAGGSDIVTLKYSTTGRRLWIQQIGANSLDEATGVAVSDAVYVTGYSISNPNLVGEPSHGGFDAYLMHIEKNLGIIMGIDQ